MALAAEFRPPPNRPALMGVLNVTPDSFSDGGSYPTVDAAIEAALCMVDDGADLIDVGGESTRPGALPVSVEEELRRTIPIVGALARRDVSVSIDTMKPEVASAALEAGAVFVNDVGGLRAEGMLEVVVAAQCSVCIMHMKGEPSAMQENPEYSDVVREVRSFLLQRAVRAEEAGVKAERIWIDPGIGFGKSLKHNLALLSHLDVLSATGFPVLVGVSRKSFVGRVLGGLEVHDRLEGTLAAQVVAQVKGARMLRAHDIKPARRAIELAAAILEG